ncbi:hypothetical protein QFZ30_003123 [Arthrobacter pascens]|uniref:hypothetical protein n=1 Tax=Arthrobacter pascens TaxID=1677 RepID=UPI002790A70C|nr:hypothetical protein [Arthrobacter pascens]MDQ0679741.1 hypothetical protein [Arthrobacter pascens]
MKQWEAPELELSKLVNKFSRGSDVSVPKDNYGEFLVRLDEATEALIRRRESLGTTIDVITRLYEHNLTGVDCWTKRRSDLHELLSEGEETELDKARAELEDVVLKMESAFNERTQRLFAKIRQMNGQYLEIEKSLLELQKSSVKLHSSRTLSQERGNLNKAVAGLSGNFSGSPSVNHDIGLRDDLTEAREAIILAEALIEVKGG